MTKIKLCGISRPFDIKIINELKPDYIGFVFAPKSKRYITPEKASELKTMLNHEIKSVGVFVDEIPEKIAEMKDIIDVIQLHGREDENYIKHLRTLTDKIIIKAFKIKDENDIRIAEDNIADYVLLDSGEGSGRTFNWKLIKNISRPYFLAGGLNTENISSAMKELKPFAVDVSSGIETDGIKDELKMRNFVATVRKENNLHD